MTSAELKKHILEGVAAGETVVIARQMFWDIRWLEAPGEPVASQLGSLLSELRHGHSVGHGIGYEGYEFFKIKGKR